MEDRPSRLEQAVMDARAEVQTLRERKRSLAFRRAGIDPTTGVGKAVAKTYDGDPDPDAIRQYAASEFGLGAEEGNPDE